MGPRHCMGSSGSGASSASSMPPPPVPSAAVKNLRARRAAEEDEDEAPLTSLLTPSTSSMPSTGSRGPLPRPVTQIQQMLVAGNYTFPAAWTELQMAQYLAGTFAVPLHNIR
eukprot:747595-Amphidinium_carterae.1